MEDITVPKELLAYVPIMWILLKVVKRTAEDQYDKIKRYIPLACIVIGGVFGAIAVGFPEGTPMVTRILAGIMLGWSPVALNETAKTITAK